VVVSVTAARVGVVVVVIVVGAHTWVYSGTCRRATRRAWNRCTSW
jgi:hypothetical protein